jgi:hypothetical protein
MTTIINVTHYLGYRFAELTRVEPSDLPRLRGAPDTFEAILSIIFGIIGTLALLIIVISGFRYITSAGDPQKANKARGGIIYALIGLVVAISAQAIMSFIVRRI